MDTPFFSIIVPVYNAYQFLGTCLESILSQSFSDWECILIDDGSKDNSGPLCDEFAQKDNRFIVIHKQNEGVSCARNTGLDVSKGRWLIFIDSDDYIKKDYLHNMAKCIETDVDFVFAGYTMFQDDNILYTSNYKYGIYKSEEKKEAVSIILGLATPWAKAYNNDIVKKWNLRFDKNLSISEDRMFLFDYLPYVEKVCVSDKKDYCYRNNINSISFTKRNPTQYIYRLDVSGEKAIRVRDTWQLSAKQFLPFIIAHFRFIQDSINRSGLQYLLDNCDIVNKVDFYGINKTPLLTRVYIYYKIGIKNALIYNRKWPILRFFYKKIQ